MNKRWCLPNPNSLLSKRIPSSCIEATNMQVTELVLKKTNERALTIKNAYTWRVTTVSGPYKHEIL